MKTHNSFVRTQWNALEESIAEHIRKKTGKNVDGPSSENPEQSERRRMANIYFFQKHQRKFSVTHDLMKMCLDHASRMKFSKQEKETECLQRLFNHDYFWTK